MMAQQKIRSGYAIVVGALNTNRRKPSPLQKRRLGAKEWYDSKHPRQHTTKRGDIAANAIGAVNADECI